MTRKLTVLLFGVSLLVSSARCAAQQHDDLPQCSTVYENHNQIDYGPLKLRAVGGRTVIRVGNQEQGAAPGACLVLFTEKDHKLVESVKADAHGRFELKNIAPGRYRLVSRAEGLCTANVPLEVVKSSLGLKTELLVHFRPTGIDTCSYGELAPTAKPGR